MLGEASFSNKDVLFPAEFFAIFRFFHSFFLQTFPRGTFWEVRVFREHGRGKRIWATNSNYVAFKLAEVKPLEVPR